MLNDGRGRWHGAIPTVLLATIPRCELEILVVPLYNGWLRHCASRSRDHDDVHQSNGRHVRTDRHYYNFLFHCTLWPLLYASLHTKHSDQFILVPRFGWPGVPDWHSSFIQHLWTCDENHLYHLLHSCNNTWVLRLSVLESQFAGLYGWWCICQWRFRAS